jgi:hypothetical protein
MAAGGKKCLEPFTSLRNRIRPRDADRIEACGAGARDQRALDARGGVRR